MLHHRTPTHKRTHIARVSKTLHKRSCLLSSVKLADMQLLRISWGHDIVEFSPAFRVNRTQTDMPTFVVLCSKYYTSELPPIQPAVSFAHTASRYATNNATIVCVMEHSGGSATAAAAASDLSRFPVDCGIVTDGWPVFENPA